MLPHQRSEFTAEPWLLTVDEEAEDDFARIRWETRVLVTLGDRPMVPMSLLISPISLLQSAFVMDWSVENARTSAWRV